MTPTQASWKSVVDRLQQIMDEIDFTNWINCISALSYESGTLIIATETDFIRQTIASRYLATIQEVCREILTDFATVELIVDQRAEQLYEPEPCNQPEQKRIQQVPRSRGWLFDYFAVDSGNRMAHAATLSIAEHLEGPAQWPVVQIYGECGVGKTHLLKAIAEKASFKRCRYALLSAETFVNELIIAVKGKTTEDFRRRLRSLELLLVDDLDFLFKGVKVASCDEFTLIIEAITAAGGCIVTCANQSPRERNGKGDGNAKLNSLLNSGLTIPISAPESKTFEEIIAFRANRKKLSLGKEIVSMIARRCTNVREAIGVINGLTILSPLEERPVDTEMLEEVLRHMGTKLPQPITIRRIQEEVARHFKLRADELIGKGRRRKETYPRQLAMFLCRELLPNKSLKEIADAFHKDSSTVVHAYQQVATSGDLVIRQDLTAIRASLKRT